MILSGTTGSMSINITARLSTKGTSPLKTLYIILSGQGYPIHKFSKYDNLELGKEVRVVLGGLAPGMSYRVYMYASNEAGLGPLSPQKTFTTGEHSEA